MILARHSFRSVDEGSTLPLPAHFGYNSKNPTNQDEPMTADLRRIRAVAASLRGIRERVESHSDDTVWNTSPFDRAVGLLEGAI
jgi:hypothetical protein